MPNHMHAILFIFRGGLPMTWEGTARRAPTKFGEPVPKSLPVIVGAFKSAVARRIHQLRGNEGSACVAAKVL